MCLWYPGQILSGGLNLSSLCFRNGLFNLIDGLPVKSSRSREGGGAFKCYILKPVMDGPARREGLRTGLAFDIVFDEQERDNCRKYTIRHPSVMYLSEVFFLFFSPHVLQWWNHTVRLIVFLQIDDLPTLRNLQYKQNQWNTENLERIFYHIITAIRCSYLTVSFKDSLVWHSTGQFQSFHMNEKASGYGWVIVLLKPSFGCSRITPRMGISDSKICNLSFSFWSLSTSKSASLW